ncbi:hypothetical protein FB45DRAFT_1062781 [Roridomyces roridus]|uniref:Uncharacterized protein n=1 Tax=Roridomyces roridus TaxID=1738132 RepID=A0AAD7BFH7_9AGAR|nr:hypothetical protein FB45DRAFT_1062781 [Roridomyces roridus]
MSRRSYQSVASENRVSKYVTDDDIFAYALRVSFLSYLLMPKPTETTTAVTPAADARDRETHSRLSALSNFRSATCSRTFGMDPKELMDLAFGIAVYTP